MEVSATERHALLTTRLIRDTLEWDRDTMVHVELLSSCREGMVSRSRGGPGSCRLPDGVWYRYRAGIVPCWSLGHYGNVTFHSTSDAVATV